MAGLRRFLRRVARLQNLRIEVRLQTTFGCVLLLIFIGSVTAFWHFQRVRERVAGISEAQQRVTAVLRINNSLVTLMSRLHRAADRRKPEYFEAEARRLLALYRADTAAAANTLEESGAVTGRERFLIDSVNAIAQALPVRISGMLELARAGDWNSLRARLSDEVDHTDDVSEELMRDADRALSQARSRLYEDINREERDSAGALAVSAISGLLLAAALGLLVTRSITGPLAKLDAAARALASGDFEYRVAVKGSNELANLADVFNRTAEALQKLFEEVKVANLALQHSNEALKRANDDLNVFAYSASHDLQEPLRNVSLYSQMIQRRYGGRLDREADEFLKYLIDGAARMSELVKDLLAYMQVEYQQDGLGRQASVTQAIQEVLANLQTVVRDTGATVSYGDLPSVAVDAVHLQQLFQNLIGNAIKYRSAQPPRIEITAAEAGAYWRFTVRDNGIGISPKYNKSIFRPFKRLHGHHEYPGTGIGLAICQKIVERYGGGIWVESQPGEGSDFKLTLPQKTSGSTRGPTQRK